MVSYWTSGWKSGNTFSSLSYGRGGCLKVVSRASRVNFDNLLVVGMEQNICSEQDIKEFDTLPFKNKIIFTTHDYKDLKSNCFIKEFAGMESVQDPYRKADVYYKYLTNRIKTLK